MYYNNPYANPYAAANLQYGVNMPSPSSASSDSSAALGAASGLASLIPYAGPFVSAALNFAGTWYQNYKQEQFYNDYMSPQARMSQMVAAGINPNAAAQGISGSSAPSISAAPMSNAGTGVGEQLGNSVNTALTAGLIKSETEKNESEKNLTDSLNVEKSTTNKYLDRMQQATLDKLVQEGRISKSFANMAAVDEAYKPAVAEQSFNMLCSQAEQMRVGVDKLNAEIMHEYAMVYQAMANGSLAEAQIHKVFSDIGLNNAMISKISHEITNIDAQTAATYQGINESLARTQLMDIQRQYEQKYLDVFKKTGYDMKQGVNSNFFNLCAQGDVNAAKNLLTNLENYLQAEGNGRSYGRDYKFDKVFQSLDMYTRMVGSLGGASILSRGRVSGSASSGSDKVPWYLNDNYHPNGNSYSHISD